MSALRHLVMAAAAVLLASSIVGCASSDAVSCDTDQDCEADQFCAIDGVCEDRDADPADNDGQDNDDGQNQDNQQQNQQNQNGDNQNGDLPNNQSSNDQNQNGIQNPQVLGIVPEDGATDVAVDTEIRVSFDQDIEDLFLSQDFVPITGPSGQQVDTQIEYLADEREIVVTPDEPLWEGTLYTIRATDSLRSDDTGLPIEEVESWFITDWEIDDDAQSLAEDYAPVVYQGTEYTDVPDIHLDIPTGVDFDGNLEGADNLDSADQSGAALFAQLYYSTTSTESHHFLHYILYYPGRRYAAPFDDSTYEHDFTGIVVVVDRDTDAVVLIDGVHTGETPGEDQRLTYRPDDSDVSELGSGQTVIDFDASALEQQAHYPLFVPSGNHAACNWYEREEIGFTTEACVGDGGQFIADTGVVLRAGTAQTYDEAQTGDEHLEMTYGLQPFADPFWIRRGDYSCGLFSVSWDLYEPGGDRPQGPTGVPALLPTSLCSTDSQSYGSLAYQWLPPTSSGTDATAGMWFLDPAYYLDVRYDFGDDFSSDYCYHPYFRIDRRAEPECESN